MPLLGGAPRLVVAYDDPALVPNIAGLSAGPDGRYVTLEQYESDIWVATLRW